MFSKDLEHSIHRAYQLAREARHEYMTVEHLLLVLLDNPAAIEVLRACHADLPRLQKDAERSRRQGFGAKLCIHPQQIATVRAVFAPSAERVAWAQRVCAAFDAAGGAAVAVDGQMVDLPVYQRARAVLRDAGLLA